MQKMIDSGMAWKMEGSVGRAAMEALRSGECMLPREAKRDYYGNVVPARQWLKPGTTGTFQNCSAYWEDRVNQPVDVMPAGDETDGFFW